MSTHPEDAGGGDAPTHAARPVKALRFVLLLGVAAICIAATGVTSRHKKEQQLAHWTVEQAIPTVAITSTKPELAARQVKLPGDVEAFYTVSIHGQVSGYVQQWTKDIGAMVKAGEVLAVVETPELDDRIVAAQGEVEKAKANLALAKVTANRWQALRNSSAVSQQAIDEKVGDESAKEAELSAATANLNRLKSLKKFANIQAPFDGVVTARNVDIGSFVNANAPNGTSQFTIADTHEMRIYVRAPEVFAAELKNGMTAKLGLPEYPNREFPATIATTSRAIDPKSRSLLVELAADNKQGLLRPGSFAEVTFEIPPDPNAVQLSANALLFRQEGTEVATLTPDNHIKLMPIRIARDYGSDVEIEGGLPANARIVMSPPESLADGDVVRVADEHVGGEKAVASRESTAAQGK